VVDAEFDAGRKKGFEQGSIHVWEAAPCRRRAMRKCHILC